MATNFFKDMISKDHPLINKVIQNPDSYSVKYYDPQMRSEAQRLACLFKALCLKKMRFNQLSNAKEDSRPINNDNLLAGIKLVTINKRSFLSCYKNNITHYGQWSWERGGALFLHYILTYYVQHGPLQTATDEFGQNDLIRACRLNDNVYVQKLLKNSDQNSLAQRDAAYFNALLISIVNHHQEIFDMLLNTMKISYQQSKEYIKFSACLNNNDALQKLLNKFFNKIWSVEHWLPFNRKDKKFLDHMMVFLAYSATNNTKAFEILLQHGASPYVKCDRSKRALSEIAYQGGEQKDRYIKEYINKQKKSAQS